MNQLRSGRVLKAAFVRSAFAGNDAAGIISCLHALSIPQVLFNSWSIDMTNLVITSELVRAARALLRWEQRHLAEASSVSLPTIKRLEARPGILVAHNSTVAALRRAFEDAGVEFTNGDQPGVRLRRIGRKT
jgi:hypothetical protein